MRKIINNLALAAAVDLSGAGAAHSAEEPKVVLVHGAFAGSSSWNGVVEELEKDRFHVIAAANPLRGVASDGVAVSATQRPVAQALTEPSGAAAWKTVPHTGFTARLIETSRPR